MYTSFFGLSEKPFAITPDPRYLYLSERHAEALAHLLYGINESGGFIQLTGEVGTGKTTVVRTLLSRIPQHADVAVILNPRVTPAEFLLTICEELGVALAPESRQSVKDIIDALNRRLLAAHAQGRRVIVIVDEAQNLAADVLEQVRLLTNLETPTQKLLQIILIGQPELRDLLARNELRQLAQRITGRYHLNPLLREETRGYIRHRLKVAGASGEIFQPAALDEIHRVSGGIPRIINVTCDRALLGAYTTETRSIDAALVRRAAGEVYGRGIRSRWMPWGVGAAGILLSAGIVAAAWRVWPGAANSKPGSSANTFLRDALPEARRSAAAAQSAARNATRDATPGAIRGAAATQTVQDSLAPILAAHHEQTSEAAAFRRLLSLWGTALVSDKNPCAQAARAGLACLEDRGSWGALRAFNRPVVLSLHDDRGGLYYVVMTQLDEASATLALGEYGRQVALAEISRYWLGDFTLVWRPKIPRPRELSLGMRGDEVRWLRRSLAAVRGAPSNVDAVSLYDESLAIAVQNFQRDHRLTADGVARLQTQIVLDTALAEPGSPLLISNAARGG